MAGVVAVLGLVATPAQGADTWTQPYPGVEHLFRTTADPHEIHVVVVDLASPGVRIRATRPADRGTTVSSFAEAYGCQVATNGDFFAGGYVPLGLAMGGSEFWAGTTDGAEESFFGFAADKTVTVSPPWDVVPALDRGLVDVVSGRELVTIDGAAADYVAGNPDVHPRTALGVDATGERLFLAVVDGRSAVSVGMTLFQLGALMADVGAWQAINLDGGGSSALQVAAEGGIVNTPSDGGQRVVANHLGVAVLRFAATVEATSFGAEGVVVEPGQTLDAHVELRNMGTDPWTPGVTKLAPTPRDLPTGVGGEPHWLQPHRVSSVDAVVAPGEVGRFALPITGGAVGVHTQAFTLVEEGITWFGDEPLGGGPADDEFVVTITVVDAPGGADSGGGGTSSGGAGPGGGEDSTSGDREPSTSTDSGGGSGDASADGGTPPGASAGGGGCTTGPRSSGWVFLLLGLGWWRRQERSLRNLGSCTPPSAARRCVHRPVTSGNKASPT